MVIFTLKAVVDAVAMKAVVAMDPAMTKDPATIRAAIRAAMAKVVAVDVSSIP